MAALSFSTKEISIRVAPPAGADPDALARQLTNRLDRLILWGELRRTGVLPFRARGEPYIEYEAECESDDHDVATVLRGVLALSEERPELAFGIYFFDLPKKQFTLKAGKAGKAHAALAAFLAAHAWPRPTREWDFTRFSAEFFGKPEALAAIRASAKDELPRGVSDVAWTDAPGSLRVTGRSTGYLAGITCFLSLDVNSFDGSLARYALRLEGRGEPLVREGPGHSWFMIRHELMACGGPRADRAMYPGPSDPGDVPAEASHPELVPLLAGQELLVRDLFHAFPDGRVLRNDRAGFDPREVPFARFTDGPRAALVVERGAPTPLGGMRGGWELRLRDGARERTIALPGGQAAWRGWHGGRFLAASGDGGKLVVAAYGIDPAADTRTPGYDAVARVNVRPDAVILLATVGGERLVLTLDPETLAERSRAPRSPEGLARAYGGEPLLAALAGAALENVAEVGRDRLLVLVKGKGWHDFAAGRLEPLPVAAAAGLYTLAPNACALTPDEGANSLIVLRDAAYELDRDLTAGPTSVSAAGTLAVVREVRADASVRYEQFLRGVDGREARFDLPDSAGAPRWL